MISADDVKRVVVVGAGVMGHSIAQVFAQGGIEVGLVDVNNQTLEHATHLIKSNLNTMADKEGGLFQIGGSMPAGDNPGE